MKRAGEHWAEFQNEGDEVRWWESKQGQDHIATMLEDSRARGTLVRRGKTVFAVDRAPAKTISIRLPEHDLERARVFAERKGVGYQTYMKMLLHEALDREQEQLPRRRKAAGK